MNSLLYESNLHNSLRRQLSNRAHSIRVSSLVDTHGSVKSLSRIHSLKLKTRTHLPAHVLTRTYSDSILIKIKKSFNQIV